MFNIICGSAEEKIKEIPDKSIDCIITDPPYPYAKRSYGIMKEKEWMGMMMKIVEESKRVLKDTGSAVFILQPNGKKIGKMRLWLYKFILKASKSWNLIQDVYWFNPTAAPNMWCNKQFGLLRPSIKHCVWLGNPDCYRDQSKIMWYPSEISLMNKAADRCTASLRRESGYIINHARMKKSTDDKGLSTPFNLVVSANTGKKLVSEKYEKPERVKYPHPAKTPERIARWWSTYICPEEGTVLDPFCGSGTIGKGVLSQKKNYIGIEKDEEYCKMTLERLNKYVNG